MLYRPTLPPKQGYVEVDGRYIRVLNEGEIETNIAVAELAETLTNSIIDTQVAIAEVTEIALGGANNG